MIKHSIVADDSQVFCLGLCDQHPIERIFVGAREETCPDAMGSVDGKHFEASQRQSSLEIA